MVNFINSFLTYFIITIAFLLIVFCAVKLGAKLRTNKDAKTAVVDTEENKQEA